MYMAQEAIWIERIAMGYQEHIKEENSIMYQTCGIKTKVESNTQTKPS